MSKTAVTVIVLGLIALGAFFYMGSTSSKIENEQHKVAETVTKPLVDAKSVDELDEDRKNADKEKMDEVMGEDG